MMKDELEQLPPLSGDGIWRREAILSIAKGHASRRRFRRIAARGIAAFVVVVGLSALLWLKRSDPSPRLDPSPSTASREPMPVPVAPSPNPATPSSPYTQFNFALIQTNESVADTYTMRGTSRVITVDDDQLLDSLHREGVDAGIAQMGSRALLVLNDTFKSSTP